MDDAGPDAGDVTALLHEVTDPRIRYTKNEQNLGLAGNWNRSLEQGSTGLVGLLHLDDELEPGYTTLVLDGDLHIPVEPSPTSAMISARVADDDPDVSNTGRNHVFNSVEEDRLVDNRNESLGAGVRKGLKACARAAR